MIPKLLLKSRKRKRNSLKLKRSRRLRESRNLKNLTKSQLNNFHHLWMSKDINQLKIRILPSKIQHPSHRNLKLNQLKYMNNSHNLSPLIVFPDSLLLKFQGLNLSEKIQWLNQLQTYSCNHQFSNYLQSLMKMRIIKDPNQEFLDLKNHQLKSQINSTIVTRRHLKTM